MSSQVEIWDRAFDEWLHEDPKSGAPRPAATVNAYAAAWADFRSLCSAAYWEVTGLDVRRWLDDMRTRQIPEHIAAGLVENGRRRPGQRGLGAATIRQRLTAISAFYAYCEHYEILDDQGELRPLFDANNPARSRMVKRPKAPRNNVEYLTAPQLRRLLDAIADFGQRNLRKAKRDYALFLSYILTAGRNSEIRNWRWGDLDERADGVYYHWANKGKAGWDQLPDLAWQAVRDYLRETGRLATMAGDDYVFVPLSDSATRFRRADGSQLVPAERWTTNRPLSPQEVNRCYRQYAKLAGLGDVARRHVHDLRHGAYMLLRQAGLSLEERSRLLHHSSLAITTVYDHQVAGQRNESWTKAAQLLGLGAAPVAAESAEL